MLVSLVLNLGLLIPVALSGYAPVAVECPQESLVRPAIGLSQHELAYRQARKVKADVALKEWLLEQDPSFDTCNLPTVALTSSGGGYRALLSGAGVIQGFDKRDSNVSTSGLFQAFTYHAGLSGGSWLLSSFAANDYPTISYLRDTLWKPAFRDGLLDPAGVLAVPALVDITTEVTSKEAAGYHTTLTDPWGRLLSYQLLNGTDGGVSTTLSSITGLSNFTLHKVPYPIITSLGVKTFNDECGPGPNATTYEFTPYEFGSWDRDVSAFTPTKYLGSSLKDGKPTGSHCTENYDNLGYVLGTSSTLFNEVCVPDVNTTSISGNTTGLLGELAILVGDIHEVSTGDLYAVYKNPFYQYKSPSGIINPANNIQAQEQLTLVDGGEALQNNPIFPLLEPSREVSVIVVNDNSADTKYNFPNGSEILTTYVQSFNHNLTRMPYIPPVATFIAQGLNQRATFFGCNDTSKITIVYLPNHNYTFASNTSTLQLEYPEAETTAMIANGVQIASQGGKMGWGTCLGCALMMKTGSKLPKACATCFREYCYSK